MIKNQCIESKNCMLVKDQKTYQQKTVDYFFAIQNDLYKLRYVDRFSVEMLTQFNHFQRASW